MTLELNRIYQGGDKRRLPFTQEHRERISESLKTGAFFYCEVCGSKFWRKQYAIKRGENRFCTKSCYFEWQKGRRKTVLRPANKIGENNPNWKGGVCSENQLIRHSPAFISWRNAVFERDNWTCQECGDRSAPEHYVRIEAHHIKPFATYPDLRFELTNGITLCKKCHAKKPKGVAVYA